MRGAIGLASSGGLSGVTQRPEPSASAMPALGAGLLGARIVASARTAAALHMAQRVATPNDQASRLRAMMAELGDGAGSRGAA